MGEAKRRGDYEKRLRLALMRRNEKQVVETIVSQTDGEARMDFKAERIGDK
jgi:hypothetical protein